MWAEIYTSICNIIEFLVGVIVILGITAFIAAMIFVIYCNCSDLLEYIKEVSDEQVDR